MARVIEEDAPREKVIVHEHDSDRSYRPAWTAGSIILTVLVVVLLLYLLGIWPFGNSNNDININPPDVNVQGR